MQHRRRQNVRRRWSLVVACGSLLGPARPPDAARVTAGPGNVQLSFVQTVYFPARSLPTMIVRFAPRSRRRFMAAMMMFLAAAAAAAAAHHARAEQQQGITVSGTGTVKSKPTEVEIGAMVSGEAELTNDAMVKYRDAKKRAVAAIEGLKIKDMAIESNGVSINQAIDPNAAQMMMQGRAANMGKPKVQAS